MSDLKPRSREVTDGMERAPARAMLRAVGMTDGDWDNPQVGRPPTLGEHTAAVLGELGYSHGRIAELKEKRAI